MNAKTPVVVCGSSLYMASLAAGLSASPTVDVLRVRPDPTELDACLREPGRPRRRL